MPDPEKFSEPRSGKENFFWPSRGSGSILPRKILKMKGPRLANNAFAEIEAWKN